MANDKLMTYEQGSDMITELNTIAANISQINKNIDLGANKVTSMAGYTLQSDASNITTSDTLNQAVSKLENRVETNKTNIASLQGQVETSEITLSDMANYVAGTVHTGYVDNVAGITGYVTVRTYAEPNSRKMQIIEAQDGTTLTRYYNGSEWTTFENNLSSQVNSMNDVISAILINGGKSWDTVQAVVRAGLGAKYYPVGTLLYDNIDDSTGTAFRVVGYDNFFDETLTAQGYTHSMTLLEEKINYSSMQFDAPEAWLYASFGSAQISTGETAQKFRFTIPNYDPDYGGNKIYIFEMPANTSIPVESAENAGDGGQITLAWAYNQQPASVSAYSNSSSTTAIFTATISVWNGTDAATDLGTIKLAMSGADSNYGKLNHIHRARYGSNNYYQSGMRQWLNSATASDWWNPTNIFDRPYSNRGTAGRLSTLNANMTSKIATPTITCHTNTVFETGYDLNVDYTVKDKIFLLSQTEVGFSDSPVIGSALQYYIGATNTKRIKYKTNNTAQHWWLRTPYPTNARSVRVVDTSGALNYNGAYITTGSASACIIQ